MSAQALLFVLNCSAFVSMTFPYSEIVDPDILDYPFPPPVFIENKTFLVLRVNRACRQYLDVLHNLPVPTFRSIEHDHG